ASAKTFYKLKWKIMATTQQDVEELVADRGYEAGFYTDIESDTIAPGLDEDVIRLISRKKDEPEWMLEWRLEAFREWQKMTMPSWQHVHFPKPDFQAISYFSQPKSTADKPKSLDEVDPKLLETYNKLGIPLKEQEVLAGVEGAAEVAVDAVFDSVSVATTFREKLADAGVIFCPISEAIREYPDLVREHIGTVVPKKDNFFAALNSAVFTDGS